jgi:flagellar basal-body rod protein FlgC
MFESFNISASGLTAQRLRMDIISDNISNVNTTRTSDGGPYRRKVPVFAEKKSSFNDLLHNKMSSGDDVGGGVRVSAITEDQSPFRMVYKPQHPDANQEGYVAKPNVNITTEMVDMISASRAYEANVTALNTSKKMIMQGLKIGQG